MDTNYARGITRGMATSYFFLVCIAASQASPAQADTFYGWERQRDINGEVDVVSIDPATGQATFLFKVAIPAGYEAHELTCNPRTGKLYGTLVGASAPRIAEISLNGSSSHFPIVGLQGSTGIQGMEWHPGYPNGVIVACSWNSTGTVNALCFVSTKDPTKGKVTKMRRRGGIVDQDHLAANSRGGPHTPLYVHDVNDPTGGFTINRYSPPLGREPWLFVFPVYNGPVTPGALDVAIDSAVPNRIYVSHSSDLRYYDLGSQTEVVVGNFLYFLGLFWGIAACPSAAGVPAVSPWGIASLVALLSAAGVYTLRRRPLR